MKYKVGDSFLIPTEIKQIYADGITPYFVGAGWWSEAALDDMQQL